MPSLSTHVHFAALVLPPLGLTSQTGSFLLGATAPDASEPDSEESFSQHHFKTAQGRISLENFLRQTNFIFKLSNMSSWSFHCGYYSHLWLDVFYRDKADHIPFKRPVGMTDTDLRKLIKKETEMLNAPFVLNASDVPMPPSEDFLLPFGLEFLILERCVHLFREVVKQSQTWSKLAPTFESVEEAKYAEFLEEASTLFMKEFRDAA